MHFKPTKKFNSRGHLKKDPLIIFRRWYAIILSPIILGVHIGIIPIQVAVIPKTIILLMAFLVLCGLYQFIFTQKIFRQDLSLYKNPIIQKSTILEIFGYTILSLCLFYVGWINIFCLYAISIILMIFVYIFLLAKQYDQINQNRN